MTINMETICCGREMQDLGFVDSLDMCIHSLHRWLCPRCGHVLDLIDFAIDEDDMTNQLEVYGETQPSSPNQMKGGDG
jgi:hypothetical protein